MYSNILDFGCGKAQILKPTLNRHAYTVKCVDKGDKLPNEKFEVIVCASVLEFVPLEKTLKYLKKSLAQGGVLIGSSPMTNWVTASYLKYAGDKSRRNTHTEIMDALREFFKVLDYKEWNGLYFSFKAVAK